MEIFNDESYKYISKSVEEKLPILRKNKHFDEIYLKLSDTIDEFERKIPEEQKEKFNEIIQLFLETEEYYFALSYSLGVKYGKDLNEL